MSTTNRGGKSGRDKSTKGGTHSLQNGKTDTSAAGVKHQPTAEQLRIAQITSDKADMEPEVTKKVTQVCELTGRTQNEVLGVLHDCDYDINQAVEILLEKQGDQANDWHEISKKKKVPVTGKAPQSTGTGSGEIITDMTSERNEIIAIDPDRTQDRHFDSAPRGRRGERGPPRFNRGRGGGSANGDKGGSGSRERPFDQGASGRGGRRRGGYSNSGGGVGRGFGRGFYNNRNNFDAGAPHIDTWSNDKTPNGDKDPVISTEPEWGTEDWTADEWSGSLEESRVFTASSTGAAHITTAFGSDNASSSTIAVSSSASSSFFDASSLPSQVYVASSTSSSGLRAPGSNTVSVDGVGTSSLIGDSSGSTGIYRSNVSISQDSLVSGAYDLNLLLQQSKLNEQYGLASQQQKMAESYSQEQSAAYLSRYNQEATEALKNAVGIGNSALSGRSAVGMDPIGHNMSSSQSVMQNCVPAPVAKPQQQSQQQRPKLPPPSKIPASAVEMPASMNSAQLDVQFGNWDIPSMTAAVSSSGNEAANLSFTADLSAQSHYGAAPHSLSQVSGSTLHGPSGHTSYDMPVSRPVMTSAGTGIESSKQSLLTLEELGLASGSKAAPQTAASVNSYPNNANGPKDYVNQKMLPNQQSTPVGYPSSQAVKSSPYTPSQTVQQALSAANQTGSHTSMPSQLPFSQGATSYPGLDAASAIPSIYKSSAPTTSAGPAPVFSTQQPAVNQYGSASSFAGYPNSVAGDVGATSSLAAAAQQQQYSSYTGSAAPGFGPQPMIVGSGTGYGPSQSQTAAYAAGSGHHGAGNKTYNSANDKQQPSVVAYSTGSLSSQTYEPTNSYQFGSGQLPSGAGGSGYALSSGQYQSGGQLSYQGVAYNQSSVAPGYDTAGSSVAPGYGNSTHSYPYQRQVRDNVAASGNYQNTSDANAIVAGYQRAMSAGLSQAGGNGAVQQSTTTAAQSVGASSSSSKLSDSLGKLSMKDGQVVASSVTATGVQYDATSASTSLSTLSSTTSSSNVGLLSSTAMTTTTSRTISTAPATTKSSVPVSSKAVVNMPVGGPAVMNNYMIAQPPGFQLATYGYPTPQQPLQYTYEDLQMLQSGQRFPVPYYGDMPPFQQPVTTMTGRETSAAMNAQSYAAGADTTKLAPIDPMSPVGVQPTPVAAQQPTVPGSASAVAVQQQQQSYLNPAAMHPAAAAPAGYSYYYPGTAGIMSVGSYYTPMIQMGAMGGLAVPLNPAHGVTTATTQYQKAATAAMYGSHAGYNVGGQTQDYTKSFGASQSASKGPTVAAGAGTGSNDMLAGANAFGKNHVPSFDKSGFHSGTPPPPFNMAAAQSGAALGSGYGAPYMQTMIPHQSHSTQIMHHPMSQDGSITGRGGVPQNQTQQPKSGGVNKGAGYSTGYWGAGTN